MSKRTTVLSLCAIVVGVVLFLITLGEITGDKDLVDDTLGVVAMTTMFFGPAVFAVIANSEDE